MSVCWMPGACAATPSPAAGVWLGAHSSILPSLNCADAVLRLERRVRDERIHVGALRRPCAGAGERLVDVAVLAQLRLRTAPLPSSSALRLEALAALRRRRVLRPRDLQLLARRLRLPPAVGDDGDAAAPAPCRLVPPSTTKACFTPGSVLISSRFARRDLRAEHRRLLVDGVQHAGQREVDAEDRLAGDDVGRVDALHRLADDLVVLRILQRDRRQRRHRQLRGGGRQLAVARRAVAARRASRGPTRVVSSVGRHAPLLRGRGDQHLTARRRRPGASASSSSASRVLPPAICAPYFA